MLWKNKFNITPSLSFYFFCALSIFFISCEYGITRPVSSSFFLKFYSFKTLPYAWLLMVPLNFLVIFFYDRFLQKLGCIKTFMIIVTGISVINLSCAFFVSRHPLLSFLQYIWKDIYILFMFKQVWSLIHANSNSLNAKFLYGILTGFGALGSVFGGLISGFCAVSLTSEKLFFLTPLLYSLVFSFYWLAYKKGSMKEYAEKKSDSPLPAFSLIKGSNLLIMVLCIVVFMQLATALADYQFNDFLQKEIPQLDLRTEYYGKLSALINGISVVLQFVGSYLVVHFLGLKNAHLFMPIVLCGNTLLFFLFPSFLMASSQYVVFKSIDFSIFCVLREMLYLPMRISEKFRAKAVIDVFAARSAKALASLLLLGLQSFLVIEIRSFISFFSFAILTSWIVVIIFMFKFYEQAREENLGN